jgi:hypothetical protein
MRVLAPAVPARFDRQAYPKLKQHCLTFLRTSSAGEPRLGSGALLKPEASRSTARIETPVRGSITTCIIQVLLSCLWVLAI